MRKNAVCTTVTRKSEANAPPYLQLCDNAAERKNLSKIRKFSMWFFTWLSLYITISEISLHFYSTVYV